MQPNDIIISEANSIRFAVNNDLAPSFDNTLFNDEYFNNGGGRHYSQPYLIGDVILFQVKCGFDAKPRLTQKFYDGSADIVHLGAGEKFYDDFVITEYLVTVGAGCYYFTMVDTLGTVSYTSEPVEGLSDLTNYEKIEWFNLDPISANNNFQFDYSTDAAKLNVNFLYINADLKIYTPSGESTVYDNQNEAEKVKESIFRVLKLNTGLIPRYLAEKLTIAQSHDKFICNDVEYIVKELPGIEPGGSTNWSTFEADLTQKNVLGLNTDDIGYDCDSIPSETMIENKVNTNATVNGSFLISDGFNITQVIANVNSGTDVTLKIGTTPGGDEVIWETPLSGQIFLNNNVFTPQMSGTYTVYYSLGGTSPNVDLRIQTIDNITTN